MKHARSAITGRFVTWYYAHTHPKTTVIEHERQHIEDQAAEQVIANAEADLQHQNHGIPPKQAKQPTPDTPTQPKNLPRKPNE